MVFADDVLVSNFEEIPLVSTHFPQKKFFGVRNSTFNINMSELSSSMWQFPWAVFNIRVRNLDIRILGPDILD